MRVTNGEETYEVDPANLKAAAADGFVPVVKVSNGKNVFEVHPKNVEAAGKDGFKVISGGYDNVPDDQLGMLQKGERALQRFGLIKPGEEMLAPGNYNAAKKAAPYVAAGTAAAMGGMALGTAPVAAVSTAFPESITTAGSLAGKIARNPWARKGLLALGGYKAARALDLFK